MTRSFQRLFRHANWANQRILDVLRQRSPSEARALELLGHVLAAEHVWLARLRGVEGTIAIWPSLSVEECAGLAAENEAGYRAYLGSMTDDALATAIAYRNSKGEVFRTPAEDILTHVSLHGSYHRGQIARALRELDIDTLNTDFILFSREGL